MAHIWATVPTASWFAISETLAHACLRYSLAGGHRHLQTTEGGQNEMYLMRVYIGYIAK